MMDSSPRRRLAGRIALALSLALVVAAAAGAAGDSASPGFRGPAVEGLQRWLDGIRDLQADFEQTLVSGALGAGSTESGRLYVERPGRMRWDYTRPEAKTAILIGDRTFLYLPEDRQLVRGYLPADQSALPGLLAGTGRIADLFEVAALPGPADGDRTATRVRLVPKGRPDGFSEVVLALRPPDFAIESAEVLDAAGNRTSYRFRSVRKNRGVPAGIFAFEPPPGTEITDQP